MILDLNTDAELKNPDTKEHILCDFYLHKDQNR